MSTLTCRMCRQKQKRVKDLSFIGFAGYCKQCSLTQTFANSKWNYICGRIIKIHKNNIPMGKTKKKSVSGTGGKKY